MPEPSAPDQPQDGQTLTEILSLYESSGYTGQMAARDGGRVICFTCREESPASEMTLRELRRTLMSFAERRILRKRRLVSVGWSHA